MGAKSQGLAELALDLGVAADTVVEQAKKVVGKGCLNIKKDAQRIVRAASTRGYLPHYPRAIGYDVTAHGTTITGNVGPDRNKLQGGLGRIIEYGTVNNAPIPHLNPALDAEFPRFVEYAEQLAMKLVMGQPGAAGPVNDPGGG